MGNAWKETHAGEADRNTASATESAVWPKLQMGTLWSCLFEEAVGQDVIRVKYLREADEA